MKHESPGCVQRGSHVAQLYRIDVACQLQDAAVQSAVVVEHAVLDDQPTALCSHRVEEDAASQMISHVAVKSVSDQADLDLHLHQPVHPIDDGYIIRERKRLTGVAVRTPTAPPCVAKLPPK